MKFIGLFLLIISSAIRISAQDRSNQKFHSLELKQKIKDEYELSFKDESSEGTIVIRITNEKGDLIFMDTQYKFTGAYKNNIPMKGISFHKLSVDIRKDRLEYKKEFLSDKN